MNKLILSRNKIPTFEINYYIYDEDLYDSKEARGKTFLKQNKNNFQDYYIVEINNRNEVVNSFSGESYYVLETNTNDGIVNAYAFKDAIKICNRKNKLQKL
jgi:hypothetical protein